MDVIWFILLGLLLTGYFACDGVTTGSGILLRALGRTERERRAVITSFGPFFLANEVWLIATGGVLLGAFPLLERHLLAGLHPFVVAVLVAWVLRDAAVWFRSRIGLAGWRSRWDRLLVVASCALAALWGLVLGVLMYGLPSDHPDGDWLGRIGLYTPLWAVVVPAVLCRTRRGVPGHQGATGARSAR